MDVVFDLVPDDKVMAEYAKAIGKDMGITKAKIETAKKFESEEGNAKRWG
jgi:hypothetical protein